MPVTLPLLPILLPMPGFGGGGIVKGLFDFVGGGAIPKLEYTLCCCCGGGGVAVMEKFERPLLILLNVGVVFVFVLPQGFAAADEEAAALDQSMPPVCGCE